MITDFEDFCTWVYVIIDDIWQQLAPLFRRPGPTPEVSDSELITMAVVGECRGWHQETKLISNWHEHTNLFPRIPERTRFSRRRRNLMFGINLIHRTVLQMMDLAQDDQRVIDSLATPVMACYLVPTSPGDWKAHGARFGKVPSKKETIFSYKLHLLITLNGLVLDFQLAPANAPDLTVGEELLANHTDLDVIGDKEYVSAEVAAKLVRRNGTRLLTLPRRNQKQQLPQVIEHLINSVPQIIQTVNRRLATNSRSNAHMLIASGAYALACAPS